MKKKQSIRNKVISYSERVSNNHILKFNQSKDEAQTALFKNPVRTAL